MAKISINKDQSGIDQYPFPVIKTREESKHPTLSDFDRIRLETATGIYIGNGNMGEALAEADELINLIMDNPFKRTT